MTQRRGNIVFGIVAFLVYVVAVVGVALAMNQVRSQVLSVYGTDQALENWQKWRDDAGNGDGPVERHAPASELPPALMLMQHHFNVCLGFSLLLTTVLFMTLLFMIRGAFFYEQSDATDVAGD